MRLLDNKLCFRTLFVRQTYLLWKKQKNKKKFYLSSLFPWKWPSLEIKISDSMWFLHAFILKTDVCHLIWWENTFGPHLGVVWVYKPFFWLYFVVYRCSQTGEAAGWSCEQRTKAGHELRHKRSRFSPEHHQRSHLRVRVLVLETSTLTFLSIHFWCPFMKSQKHCH